MFLKTLEKYYMVYMGIRNQLIGLEGTDYGHILDNIICLELLRRGYDVAMGKIGNLEVDFVARKVNGTIYHYVCATIMGVKTRDRELSPLKTIKDNYLKYILGMDQMVYRDLEGIRIKNIKGFLLD